MSATYDTAVRPAFDDRSETYRLSIDTDSSGDASTMLVLSLCSVTGDEPTQIRPLSYAVDPDVLENHVQGQARGANLSFEFHGHRVTVRDDGQLEFSPLDGREA